MAELHGVASWPGAALIESCSYTCSHGITPGTALLRMLPQAVFPDAEGDLVITDGNEVVVVPGCKIDRVLVETGPQGTIWSLSISDRRWRWQGLGALPGCYNQLDPHGKLVPWTIASPTELAVACLEAMGEVGYTLNLPAGLPSAAGQQITTFLPNGLNFPPSNANPPINWDYLPPAEVLQQLADLFGCRVVYQLSTDSVLITPAGIGADLPPGSLARQGPSVKNPTTPDAVGVIGAPTRYQCRLLLKAVGEEWDGSYRPIDDLSYAPLSPGAVQITTVTSVGANLHTGVGYQLWIDPENAQDASTSKTAILVEYVSQGGDTDNDVVTALETKIGANEKLQFVDATVNSGTLTLTGNAQGVPFSVATREDAGAAGFVNGQSWGPPNTTQQAASPSASWETSPPPLFPGVRATDRLTLQQAQDLARRSVWRLYQVDDTDCNVLAGVQPILIPGYGRLLRRQQLVLQSTQVDQIVPQPLDGTLRDRIGRPLVVNYYNGYSKDKPAAVYGSVAQFTRTLAGIWNADIEVNTPLGSQVFVPFSVDPVWQLVVFGDHVYFQEDGRYTEPTLALQTAVLVRDPDTNQVVRFQQTQPLPGRQSGTPPKYELHEDVQLEVTSAYGPANELLAYTVLSTDPYARAAYYLAGLAAQYNLSGGQTAEYNGIVGIDLDGAIQQVSWRVGPGGAATEAGRNTEFHLWVPTYPARRRAEALPALERVRRLDQRVDLAHLPDFGVGK